MTLNLSVTDDQFARYMRRTLAIAERLGKSLSYDDVMETLQRIHDGQIFRFVVDYDQLLEQMIAAGHYDGVNFDIAKYFRVKGKKDIVHFEGRYYHPNCRISSENVVGGIEQLDMANPWVPAETEHTLAFGAKFPDEQRKHPIVGLGSVAQIYGLRRVLYLSGGDSCRYLDLGWWADGWNPRYRFLAVREVSAS